MGVDQISLDGEDSANEDRRAIAASQADLATDADGDYEKKWAHLKSQLTIRRTAEYCVVITPDLRIDWATTKAYDQAELLGEKAVRTSRSAALAEIAVAEMAPCDDLPANMLIRYKSLLGEALVLCIEGEFESAQKTMTSARLYLQARSEEISRHWYLGASAKAALAFLVVAATTWIHRDLSKLLLGTSAFWLLLSCCGGAVGAMFSVIARSGELQVDASAGKTLHTIEGVSRIVAGAISGLVVAMAVRSDIVFGAFASGKHLTMVSMLAAIAAGTGERLATSIISKFDETQVRVENHTTT
ncbi:hypothetical protein WJ70_21860 [Burkholderia ubonensis]|uniref:hypothetical protein n=1 Tax=Burkholderia ubonensis TaxID=101571 RepID=UPI00075DB16E|nr:hypothetical protein [Burkholderia ubonensis]KVO08362.1 hypothetical protein WJ70_21860 [Burkholderia ubonensis]